MKIKKFQKPADKLDKPVEVSPEREAEIRASQQAELNNLWKQRREYEQQSENKTDNEKYLDFLDKHGILYADDYTRKLKLQQLGYSEEFDKDGNPILSRNLEPPLKSEDFDFAMALVGGLGTKAAAKAVGWLPTIAEEIGAGAMGTAATYGSNYLGQAIDNKYGTNVTPWLTIGGGLTGAFLGGYAGTWNTPMMSRTMLHQAKGLDWATEGVTIPNKAPKWKWARSKNAHYDNGTIKTPFFARKSQVAHELGHYVGDYGVANPKAVRGAFTPGYQYSPNAEMELNAAENFADYFKTKLGYPYTGKDVNLIERQNAFKNETLFDDVVKPDARVYESKLTEAERLGIPKGERNQTIKPKSIQYDVTDGNVPTQEFLDDFAAFKQSLAGNGSRIDITDMFDSPWYKQRLLNQGVNETQANQLIENLKARTNPDNLIIVDKLNSVRNFKHVENGIPMDITPERAGQYARHSTNITGLPGKSLIQVTTKVDPIDAVLHEVGGHRSQSLVSDFKDMYKGQVLSELGEKATVGKGLDPNYYLDWDEVRARALTIAKQMSDFGWNPNSPGQVNVWLNKNILTNLPTNSNQGALYYSRPEFIKAVTTGFKEGGKINPQ